jgi:hypothetical protein
MRNRAVYEDKDFWPIKCPDCLNEFTEEIGRMKAGAEIRYPDCKIILTDPAKQFLVHLAKARNGELDPWGHMIRLQKPE